MSLSEIIEPADKLLYLLLLPRIIYFCGFFAYDGLKNGVSLTHKGMQKGIVARIYGVFYLLFAVLNTISIYFQTRDISAIALADMQKALLFAVPVPEIGYVFFGVAVFLFFLREGVIRFGQKNKASSRIKPYRIQQARRFTNWMIALPVGIALKWIFGLPEWVYIIVFVFFMYFSPYTSPRELKKYMIVPEDIKYSKKKSLVRDEIL